MRFRKTAAVLAGVMLCSSMQAVPMTAAEVRMSTVTCIGDADTDGSVSLTDAVKLSRFLLAADDSISANADINGDGAVDVFDLAYLKQMLLGKYTPEDYTKLVINEVCASNKKCYISADGSKPDWLELYNGSATTIHLGGYGISDGSKNLFKYTFPEDAVIPAGGYVIVLCDGDGKVTAQDGEHLAPFNISAQKSETLYLTHPYNGTIDAVTIPEGMQTDATFGRTEDGSEGCAVLTPTPGASNSGAVDTTYVTEPVFSVEGGFYDSQFTLELEAKGCEILYTLDGSDPTSSATAAVYRDGISVYNNTNDPNVWSAVRNITLDMYFPPNYPVDKGIVVRAAARDADGNYSRVISNSYFVGKTADYYRNLTVISISADGDGFFNEDTGIYMVGTKYYEWRNSPAYDPFLHTGNPANPTNYNNRGKEWEVPAAMQVFEAGDAVYSAGIGVRINGNWSRANAQKSLRIYARGNTSKLSYALIPELTDADGKKITSFDNFIVRNSGNDCGQLYMRDALLQDLCRDRANGMQGYQSCIVFINGEFWGFYNIRERIDENYLASHYHINKNDVTTIKNLEPEGDMALADEFAAFCQWGATADMTDAANYSRVCETIDVEGLMDLIAIETYINNHDFATETVDGLNNVFLWRANTIDAGNPYTDGKWRFVLSDLEYSTNLYGVKETAPEFDSLNEMNRDASIQYNFIPLFYNLLHNAGFRQEFEARYRDIMENVLSTSRVLEGADAYARSNQSAIEDTKRRFGNTWNIYNTEMESFRSFFRRRPEYAERYLKELLEAYQ